MLSHIHVAVLVRNADLSGFVWKCRDKSNRCTISLGPIVVKVGMTAVAARGQPPPCKLAYYSIPAPCRLRLIKYPAFISDGNLLMLVSLKR